MDDISGPADQIFAVTTTSVYLVQAVGERSIAVKLATRKSSKIAQNTEISEGGKIAIGKYIQAILPDTAGDKASSGIWSYRTSAIVALFLEEGAARSCLQEGSRNSYDTRWIASSRNALKVVASLRPAVLLFRDQLPQRAASGLPVPTVRA